MCRHFFSVINLHCISSLHPSFLDLEAPKYLRLSTTSKETMSYCVFSVSIFLNPPLRWLLTCYDGIYTIVHVLRDLPFYGAVSKENSVYWLDWRKDTLKREIFSKPKKWSRNVKLSYCLNNTRIKIFANRFIYVFNIFVSWRRRNGPEKDVPLTFTRSCLTCMLS